MCTYQIVEQILPLRAALEPCGHTLLAVVQQDFEAPSQGGDLPNLHTKPWYLAKEGHDTVRA